MHTINPTLSTAIRDFVCKHCRLLERQLFEYYFNCGSKAACLKALLAYQNPDGGFGHGLEPDLRCPQSSAIGAETAMWYLHLLDAYDCDAVGDLVQWIASNQNDAGIIEHPSPGMLDYSHETWWSGADDKRILSLAAFLQMHDIDHPPLFEKARHYFDHMTMPDNLAYYDYPQYLYAKYCGQDQRAREIYARYADWVESMIQKNADHYPIFARAWFDMADLLDEASLDQEAQNVINAITEDGGFKAPYPNLPWWRPIWMVDALVLLKRKNLLALS